MRCGSCKESGPEITLDHVRECHGQATLPKVDPAIVPEGRYAMEVDGVIRFYKVRRPDEGKWTGFTFVDLLVGSPGDYRHFPVRNRGQRMALLARLAEDPQAAMTLYGHESKHCGKCGAALSDPESLARGVGPICAGTLGWAA